MNDHRDNNSRKQITPLGQGTNGRSQCKTLRNLKAETQTSEEGYQLAGAGVSEGAY